MSNVIYTLHRIIIFVAHSNIIENFPKNETHSSLLFPPPTLLFHSFHLCWAFFPIYYTTQNGWSFKCFSFFHHIDIWCNYSIWQEAIMWLYEVYPAKKAPRKLCISYVFLSKRLTCTLCYSKIQPTFSCIADVKYK